MLDEEAHLNEDSISEAEELSFVQLFLTDLDETERAEIPLDAQDIEYTQSAETADDVPEGESSGNVKPENVEPPIPEPSEVETAESVTVTVAQPAPPEAEPDTPEEDPQEQIEKELQKQFQSLMRSFSPDYPNWTGYLDNLFDQIAGQHHFESPDDRDKLRKRLDSFLLISTECYDYSGKLDILFNELWPDA